MHAFLLYNYFTLKTNSLLLNGAVLYCCVVVCVNIDSHKFILPAYLWNLRAHPFAYVLSQAFHHSRTRF